MRSVARLALLACFALAAPTAAQGYSLESRVDEVDGSETRFMRGNVLGGGGRNDARVELNAQRATAAGRSRFTLALRYEWSGWMFIEPGPSLILMADGERIVLEGEGSGAHRQVGDRGSVTEWSYYVVTPEQIERIATAESVTVRIIGSRFNLDRDLTDENRQRFREFVHTFASPHSP